MEIYDSVTEEELKLDGDGWWGLIEDGNEYAVDYNYYFYDDEWHGCFYACFQEDNGSFYTDTSVSRNYDVDFEDVDWKEKLIKEALDFLEWVKKEEMALC